MYEDFNPLEGVWLAEKHKKMANTAAWLCNRLPQRERLAAPLRVFAVSDATGDAGPVSLPFRCLTVGKLVRVLD